MANLPEIDEWSEGIYQIEMTDDALGGDGEEAVANRQAKQLAARTLYLRNLLNLLGTEFQDHLEDVDANPHPQYLLLPEIQALIHAAIVPGVTARSITNLPAEDIGPIIVIEASEVWVWVSTAYYTGYRSPLCGAPIAGHTLTPLAHEVDAVGGTVGKVAYARLWAYAQENSLVVTQSVWTANLGAHWFVDIDANNFRLPDLRNQFIRLAAGAPDLDTANVRALGSMQNHQFQDHSHFSTGAGWKNSSGNGSGGFGVGSGNAGEYTVISGNHGVETRPLNTAMYPRLHA